jgi:hypothetical protein
MAIEEGRAITRKENCLKFENEEVILSLSDIGMFIETQEVAKI